MATVIDQLVVTLGLDAAQFNTGQKQAVEALRTTETEATRTAKNLEVRGAQAAQFYGQIKNAALGLFGVLTAGVGLERFASQTIATVTAQSYLAKSIGISTTELAKWEQAVVQFGGGDAAAAGETIKKLSLAFAEMAHGRQSSLTPFFRFLGIGLKDANGNLRSMTDLLTEASGKLSKMDPAWATQVASKYGGFDPGFINLLLQGPDAVRKRLATVEEQGLPTEESAKKIRELNSALIGLEAASANLGLVLLTGLAPALTAVLNAATRLIEWTKTLPSITPTGPDVVPPGYVAPAGMGGAIFPEGTPPGPSPWTGWSLPPPGIVPGNDIWQPWQFNGGETPGAGPRVGKQPPNWWQRNITPLLSGGGMTPPQFASPGMTPEMQGLLNTISGPESGGRYDIRNGGGTFTGDQFPEGVGPGGTSSAAGKYQFTRDTWNEVAAKLGLKDFSPANQDRAAAYLAAREYYDRTGRDLQADLRSGGHLAEIAGALKGRWPSLPGGSQSSGEDLMRWGSRYQRNLEAVPTPPIPPSSPPPPPATPAPAVSAPSAPATPEPVPFIVGRGPNASDMPNGYGGGGQYASNTNNTSSVDIGNITVHTAATDAPTIARDIGAAVRTNMKVMQAAGGPR